MKSFCCISINPLDLIAGFHQLKFLILPIFLSNLSNTVQNITGEYYSHLDPFSNEIMKIEHNGTHRMKN